MALVFLYGPHTAQRSRCKAGWRCPAAPLPGGPSHVPMSAVGNTGIGQTTSRFAAPQSSATPDSNSNRFAANPL